MLRTTLKGLVESTLLPQASLRLSVVYQTNLIQAKLIYKCLEIGFCAL